MSKDVATATLDETVSSVARKMADKGISCVVVAEGKQVKGIYTERDLARGVARDAEDVGGATMAQQMSSPVETTTLQVPVLEVAERMTSLGIKRLPVIAGDEIVGIVTQTDITRGLVLLSPLRCVCDVMSEDVATIGVEQTVAEAAQIMSQRDISCVVVLRQGRAVGMLTEKDLIRYVVAGRSRPSETLIVDAMSFPVHGIPPTYSVLSANQKMSALQLRRLVVIDGQTVRGVISQTDIMRAVRAELERVDAERAMAASAMTEQIQHVRSEVAELGQFLRTCADADGRGSPDAAATKRVVAAEIAPRVQHILDELDRL
jgi:CBS domain-containing protein